MSVEQVSLNIKRGDTWSRSLYFEYEDGSPIDITGWTIRFTVKEKLSDNDEDAKIKKIITSHTDPTNGESEISLTIINTNQTIDSYLFDIQVTTDGGEVYTIVEGLINISDDISKSS